VGAGISYDMTIFYKIPESGTGPSPRSTSPVYKTFGEFKKIAAKVLKAVGTKNLPSGKSKWKVLDMLVVLVYGWLRGVSPDHASNKLNDMAKEKGWFKPATFADGRHSRAVPHQTQVNDWLRELDLSQLKKLARAVFAVALKEARKKGYLPRELVLEFDTTLRGYWGRRRDPLIKGTLKVPGTHHARQYHGAMVHGGGMSLYVALDHVAKGDSKVPFLLDTARWLKKLGFKVKWALADREYYSFAALDSLKAMGIDVITVVKDYPQLRKAKEAYLSGRKGRVQAFTIRSGAKKGCKVQSLKCWLVIYPKDKYHLQAIRRDLRHGAMTLAAACKRLYGLVTTAAPQGHGKKFPALIRKLYRTRWKIETGFRVADVKHCPWRSDRDGTRFVDEMGRMLLLQDLWNLARVEDPRGDKFTREMFRDDVVNKSTLQINA
jgi:hypothetical protein